MKSANLHDYVLVLKEFCIDNKFASGIKNIHFGLYPDTDVCTGVSTVYSVLSLSAVEKNVTRVGFESTTLSKAVSYQLGENKLVKQKYQSNW